MIRAVLNNEILSIIGRIDEHRFELNGIQIPPAIQTRLRKNSRKRSSYASNRIEGNPLTEKQAEEAIDADPHRHFLRPEEEVRNYVQAMQLLETERKANIPFSVPLLLRVQALVEQGASAEKNGLRGPMPPGFLFAVYDAESGAPEYIPPEYPDVPNLLRELEEYVRSTDDHPLIVAAIVHYQLVTIHPFEDGNGRTARLMSGYILDCAGYGFGGIGSLEEYFAYDPAEYYRSLQMDLPPLYYAGRNDPPHPEIWITYFLRMVELYAARTCALGKTSVQDLLTTGLSHLKSKERAFLLFLLKNNYSEFSPISISLLTGESNRTVINRCSRLVTAGFLVPASGQLRIRTYLCTDLTLQNRVKLLRLLKKS